MRYANKVSYLAHKYPQYMVFFSTDPGSAMMARALPSVLMPVPEMFSSWGREQSSNEH